MALLRSLVVQIRQPFRARRLEPRRTFQLISKSTNLHIIILTPTQPFPRGTPRRVNSAGSVYFRCRISWTRFAVFSPNLINFFQAFFVQNWSKMRSKMEQDASKMFSKIHSVFECVCLSILASKIMSRTYENERFVQTKRSFS